MPKNPVTDPITDQEIAFAHLVLAGTMTDRRAAEAVGLNPDTAAYAKAKPRVQAYMHQHRETMNNLRVQQETEELQCKNLLREQVLNRLWELAALSHEATRNSASAQIKALSLIIAMEGFIPDRRVAKPKESLPPYDFYRAQCVSEEEEEAENDGTHPSSPSFQHEEDPDIPPPGKAVGAPADPNAARVTGVPPAGLLNARPFSPAYNTHDPYAHMEAEVPGTRDPYSNIKISSNRRR